MAEGDGHGQGLVMAWLMKRAFWGERVLIVDIRF